jgi:hypothetical protein
MGIYNTTQKQQFMNLFLTAAIAATFPLIVGFIWYHPKAFGTTWLQVVGMKEQDTQNANMGVIFGITYVLSFFIAVLLVPQVIHQASLGSLVGGDPTAVPAGDLKTHLDALMALTQNNFRSFQHGALHGAISALLYVTPIMAINALFERKGWKYILINAGYWAVSLALMGGLMCQFVQF